ncbi:MAG TPA: hypothetical protein VJH24_02695 [Candidatus Bilamarchaeaceae archaeon]|nr:hypothetical protein [Candidatus Bilamarchaeaceae archaeon]
MQPMQTSIALCLIAFVVFSSASFAFSVNGYLYYHEDALQLVYDEFTYNGVPYTLVKLGGREIFLLKDGEPVENVTNIRDPLRQHYQELYYPEPDELQRIRDLLDAYNQSRNDGESFPGREEATCRYTLFIDGHITIGQEIIQCVDDASCQRNALLIYQAYREGVGFGDPSEVLPILQPFAYAINSNEEIMDQAFAGWEGISDSTLEPALQYIVDSVPTLSNNYETIRTSRFRTPVNTPEDRQACIGVCYAICPPIAFNTTALDLLRTETTALLEQSRPFIHHAELSQQVEDETNGRLQFREGENQATYFYDVFEPLRQNATALIDEGDEALSTVLNISLRAKVDRLREMTREINQTIEARNFTMIEDRLDEYQRLMRNVEDGIPGTLDYYMASLEAKQEASTMLLLLETRDLGPTEYNEVQELRNASVQLDALLEPGLTTSDYSNITHTYQILNQRVRNVLKQQDENPIYFSMNKFRGLARRIGRGVSSLLTPTEYLPTTPEATSNLLLALAGVSFVAMGSLFLFLMLTVYSGMAKISRISVVGGGLVFGFLLFISLLFSGSLYYFLDKTTQQSMLDEFLFDLQSRNETFILVDASSVTVSVSGAMLSCAGEIAESMRANNKTVQIYQFQQQNCLQPEEGMSTNLSVCAETLDTAHSLFILNYSSPPQTPRFSSIFVNQMDLAGDKQYYQTCSIAQIFQD